MTIVNALDKGAPPQPDYGGLLNAYRPLPPTEQELAQHEVRELREKLKGIDWPFWGWLATMGAGLAAKAVL